MIENIMHKTASYVWLETLKDLYKSPVNSKPRGFDCKEILGHQTRVSMKYPILGVPERKLGYRFMCREAWWIMDGRNTVEDIKDFSKAISTFSNDGYHFDGAYGPRIVDQIRYIVDTLEADRDSRQAVLTIWRPNPRSSKDIPCTVSIQWLIRNDIIYCIDNMRSSDIWLGWPYDIFNFSMLTGYIMLLLRERGVYGLQLGDIILNAGSQHLYGTNIEKAEEIVKTVRTFNVNNKFNPYEFYNPVHFKNYLKAFSEKNDEVINRYSTLFGKDLYGG